MAIIHFINNSKPQTSKGMLSVLNYTMQDKKTMYEGHKYVSGVNCTPQSAYIEFNNTKRLYGKADGRLYFHFVQSFDVNENITPATAHEIALRFAQETEKFEGFEIAISTHCDRNHIHSHFVLNSVNADTGKKFHISQREIEMLMEKSDEICKEYGLSILDSGKSKVMKGISNNEKYVLNNNESWKLELAITIDNCMEIAKSKNHFLWLMSQEGYRTMWTDERKYLTFTCPNGKKCRNNKLYDEKYLKENFENEFRIRNEILYGLQEPSETEKQDSLKSCSNSNSDGRKLESTDSTQQQSDRLDRISVGADKGTADKFGLQHSDQLHQKQERRTAESNQEYCYTDENGERRYVETGWESEREEFFVHLTTERGNEELYKEALLDYSNGKLDFIIDGAGLASEVWNMIDNDYHTEDSTTMKQPRKDRKNTQRKGPVMRM